MKNRFWVIQSADGSYILNDHALTPILKNAQRFETRAAARRNKKSYNPRSSEKIIQIEYTPESYQFV